jgi:purine-nucleoside/S-methyl-5'-thioadenosine phosphorylase / adenosine deaminase
MSVSERLAAAKLDWIVPDWPAPANVAAFVTTRAGGVSTGAHATMNLGGQVGDDAAAVEENRRRFAAFLPAAPVPLKQVHGTAVAVLSRSTAASPPPLADAAVTRERAVPCTVLTADCLPVLFAERGGRAVGIAHAGWRGLAAGVLETTVGAFRDLAVAPDDLIAWLGPAIGPRAFEVGDDVRVAFGTDVRVAACFTPHRAGKWHADLYALARHRLARCGVERVFGGGYCTYNERERFYSYRREKASGRMAAVVWLV